MTSAADAPVTEQERLDLFAVYLTLRGMHHLEFDEILARPVLLGCLRCTLEAMRRRLAKRKADAAAAVTQFELTS